MKSFSHSTSLLSASRFSSSSFFDQLCGAYKDDFSMTGPEELLLHRHHQQQKHEKQKQQPDHRRRRRRLRTPSVQTACQMIIPVSSFSPAASCTVGECRQDENAQDSDSLTVSSSSTEVRTSSDESDLTRSLQSPRSHVPPISNGSSCGSAKSNNRATSILRKSKSERSSSNCSNRSCSGGAAKSVRFAQGTKEGAPTAMYIHTNKVKRLLTKQRKTNPTEKRRVGPIIITSSYLAGFSVGGSSTSPTAVFSCSSNAPFKTQGRFLVIESQ